MAAAHMGCTAGAPHRRRWRGIRGTRAPAAARQHPRARCRPAVRARLRLRRRWSGGALATRPRGARVGSLRAQRAAGGGRPGGGASKRRGGDPLPLTADGFDDAAADLPLGYRFFYYEEGEGARRTPLAPPSEASFLDGVLLPAGNVTVGCVVADAHGATCECEKIVVAVAPTSAGVDSLLGRLGESLAVMQDATAALQVLSGAVQLLDPPAVGDADGAAEAEGAQARTSAVLGLAATLAVAAIAPAETAAAEAAGGGTQCQRPSSPGVGRRARARLGGASGRPSPLSRSHRGCSARSKAARSQTQRPTPATRRSRLAAPSQRAHRDAARARSPPPRRGGEAAGKESLPGGRGVVGERVARCLNERAERYGGDGLRLAAPM